VQGDGGWVEASARGDPGGVGTGGAALPCFPGYPCLLSIAGFGPDIPAQVLGAIEDPHRFFSAKQVLKTAGLDLIASRSGKSGNNARPVISKRGKAYLRYMLYQAALVGATCNQHLRCYYTCKVSDRQRKRGIHTKMRVKLAAKLLLIAWTLMKKQLVLRSEATSQSSKGCLVAFVGMPDKSNACPARD
jgi:transposase